jgi:hypothetical protein
MRGSKETGYFHICTDGSKLPWMFRDDEDFIAGVNRIGICKFLLGIEVICFIVMDTHIHIVLYGDILQCKEFINLYKRLTGIWIKQKYDINEHLKDIPVEIIPIRDEEGLLNTIAYIDRNSIVGGYKFLATEYPWGTGKLIFRDPASTAGGQTRKLSELNRREQWSLLKSRVDLPQEWKIDTKGMLDISSFIDVARLESIFRSPARYTYFLAKKLEGVIESQFKNTRSSYLPDKEIRKVTINLSREMFGHEDVKFLDVKSKISIAKKLRYDYLSTLKQISRMVYLDEDVLKGFV